MQLWTSTFWIEFVLTPLLPFFTWVRGAATTSLYQEATSGTPLPGLYLDVSHGVDEYLQPVLDYARHNAAGEVRAPPPPSLPLARSRAPHRPHRPRADPTARARTPPAEPSSRCSSPAIR